MLLLSLLLVCLVVAHSFNALRYPMRLDDNLTLYDNTRVPLLDPPKEILINENDLSCHRVPTTCRSNADCQVCLEALASCQEFYETVILEISDDQQLIVNPGDRYCLALNNKSARSCNPLTGTWMLRQVDSGGNFALICHCDMPGLVTQLNIYDDCTFPVGCKPHGIIADVYSYPLRCVCEVGFVSEISETGTPYCRPRVMRDVMLSTAYYHRPPCQDGFLPADHPALNPWYRSQIGANVCLPDPCSVDPLTGEFHDGRVVYEETGGADGKALVMCRCSVESNIYPVYSANSMLNARYSESDFEIANACIKPLTVDRREVRSDLKVFWGRNSLKSDADMVFQVNQRHVHEPYRVLLYRRNQHPHPIVELTTEYIFKFQLHTAYVASSVHSSHRDVFQGYWHLNYMRTHINTCPLPGIGECRNPLSCGNITCTRNPCIGSTVTSSYRPRCFFFRRERQFDDVGTVGQICIWNYPTQYSSDNVPVTFYINALCATDGGYGVNDDVRTFYFTNTASTAPPHEHSTLITLLATYPFYNS